MTHEASVNAVAFSPDGKTVLTGSTDKTARLWSAVAGSPIGQPMTQYEDTVGTGGVLSPDGKTVLTGSWDNTAQLWSAADGAPIGQPLKHLSDVVGVAFSRDGKTILTRETKGGTVRLWPAPTDVPGDPRRIVLWTQVITGMELSQENLMIRVLAAETWRERRQLLDEQGGPPIP